jgi:hypothetical protein
MDWAPTVDGTEATSASPDETRNSVTTTRRSISLAPLLIPPAALVGSLVVLAIGIVMVVSESDALVAALNSPDATAADVYGGQARLAIGSSLLGAGVVGVVLSLATVALVATIRAFAPRHQEARPELAADHEPEAGSHDEDWVDVDAPEDAASTDAETADEARRMDVAVSGR